jgi:hypothetical protein
MSNFKELNEQRGDNLRAKREQLESEDGTT